MKQYRPDALLFLLFLLPPTLHRYAGATSFGDGVLVASIIAWATSLSVRGIQMRAYIMAFAVFLVLMAISTPALYSPYTDLPKTALTIAAVPFCMLAALTFIQEVSAAAFKWAIQRNRR